MKKVKILKILNFFLFIVFAITAISMILYRWGLKSLRGDEILFEIHGLSGIIFIIAAIIHFVFNFNWILHNYFKKRT